MIDPCDIVSPSCASPEIVDAPVGRFRMVSSLLSHQLPAVEWMCGRDARGGGVLADDMGLGKTITCISLMVKSDAHDRCGDGDCLNLVVVPLGLLMQWKEEVATHTDCDVDRSVLIYHGSGRKAALATFVSAGQAESFVVLTTYDVVRQEYANSGAAFGSLCSRGAGTSTRGAPPSSLFDIVWGRIFLDEAHRIRSGKNATARAVLALRCSGARWCVTGTPFNNSVEDLCSLAKFVAVAPYDRDAWWSLHGGNAAKVQRWKDRFVLRRTKAILNLPEQRSEVINLDFDPDEAAFYSLLFSAALEHYVRFKNSSGGGRFKMFGTMLSWLIRLRQVCDHPLLVLGRAWTRPYSDQSKAGNFTVKEICCACKVEADGLDELPCGHYLCTSCELKEDRTRRQRAAGTTDVSSSCSSPSSKSACEMCRMMLPWISQDDPSASLVGAPESEGSVSAAESARRYPARTNRSTSRGRANTTYRPNTKMKYLVTRCRTILRDDPTNKVVIFSQWTSCLDLIEYFLKANGMPSIRYDGDVTGIDRRDAVVKRFTSVASGDAGSAIMLSSLQCGGVGLNLSVANYVIFYDSWYNPFMEDQAADRVHRIGQTRPVTVVRLRMNKSVESDVARIQDRKREAAKEILWGTARAAEDLRPHCGQGGEAVDDGPGQGLGAGISEVEVHEIFRRAARSMRVCKAGGANPVIQPGRRGVKPLTLSDMLVAMGKRKRQDETAAAGPAGGDRAHQTHGVIVSQRGVVTPQDLRVSPEHPQE